VFLAEVEEIERLKSVQNGDAALLPHLVQHRYCTADQVVLFLPADDPARQAFSKSEAFVSLFSNPAAAIFKFASVGRPCP
jgi:hypothetical protein